MRKLILPLLALALASGCDIVDEPKASMTGPSLPVPGDVVKRVLLEDCTGFLCNNCPAAAATAQSLKDIYGDRLVLVGVHMMHFAVPEWPYDDGEFDTDFRTEAGNAYASVFPIVGLPAGLVDRAEHNQVMAMSHGGWSAAVADRMELPPTLDIWIPELTYNSTDQSVSGTVKVAVLEEMTGDHNLTLYLTEDHVIDWQLDGQTRLPQYEHRHVLRGALNSPWGQALIQGSAQPGDTLTASFSQPMPDNVLVPNNCAVVAYVYSTGGADEYEVKQVAERQLAP